MKRSHLLTIVLIVFSFILLGLYAKQFLNIELLNEHRMLWITFVDTHYLKVLIGFILIGSIAINSPIPLAAIWMILGGLLFGFHLGAILNLITNLLSAIVGYFIAHNLLHDFVEKHYKQAIKYVQKEIREDGLAYLIASRFTLSVPFFLIHLIAGVSSMRLSHFLLTTFIGVIPACVLYSYAGHLIFNIDSFHDIFNFRILFMVVILVTFALMPIWMRLFRKKPSPLTK